MASNCISRMNKVLNTLNDAKVSDVAYKAYVQNTPFKTGNAKRKTVKSGNDIDANYPYAQRLEEGYSKQAPKGMTEPAIEEVRRYVYSNLGIKI
jgi:hypothetical protein